MADHELEVCLLALPGHAIAAQRGPACCLQVLEVEADSEAGPARVVGAVAGAAIAGAAMGAAAGVAWPAGCSTYDSQGVAQSLFTLLPGLPLAAAGMVVGGIAGAVIGGSMGKELPRGEDAGAAMKVRLRAKILGLFRVV